MTDKKLFEQAKILQVRHSPKRLHYKSIYCKIKHGVPDNLILRAFYLQNST